MNANLGRVLVAFSLMLAALAIIPNTSAAPSVLPVSSSSVSVVATDYFEFAPGDATRIGTTWTLTAPDGTSIIITKATQEETPGATRFNLNGIVSSNANGWETSGSLVGSAADGTWQITVSQSAIYGSYDSASGAFYPGPTLSVSGRAIHYGITTGTGGPLQNTQYWNWRNTAANTTWDEPSTVPVCSTPCMDPINEAPDEDPNNAVFFNDNVGPVQSPFTAYTLGFTTPTNCDAVPNSTVSGAWLGGTATIFSRFTYRDGNFLGETDLRNTLGYSQTTEENEGTISNGTDSKSITYNNVAGTSYQFMVRNSTGVEALGAVQWIPGNLCATSVINIGGLTLGADQFHLEVSQAQCANDAVSFALEFDILFNLLTEDMDVQIYDSNNGSLIASYDDSEMFYLPTTGDPRMFHFADVFPPGAYVAVGRVDQIAGTDYFESKSFNVPRGSCVDSPTDLTPVLLAVDSSTTTLQGNISDSTETISSLLLSYWSNYNATEAANLAITLASLNITQNSLIQFWADYNATEAANLITIINEAESIRSLMLAYWSNYNATEAADLAITLASLNITQNSLIQFWADYNETALSDLTTILAAIANHDSNATSHFQAINASLQDIYDVVTTLNLTFICDANSTCNFQIDNDTLQAIYDNLTEHRANTLEVNMTSNFNGLGFDGLIFLFFWIAVLLFAVYQEWWFVVGFSIPGLIDTMFPAEVPFTFTEFFMLCLLGFCLEVAANRFSWGVYREKRRSET